MAAGDAVDNQACSLGQRSRRLRRAIVRPPYLGGYRYAADFWVRVGRNGEAMVAPIRKDGPDRFFGISQSFLLSVAFGNDRAMPGPMRYSRRLPAVPRRRKS